MREASNRLPEFPTPFSGDAPAVEAVRALLLARARVRLVTLTGPAGAGARLACEVAGGLADAFPDGVSYVWLGAVSEPEFFAASLARALGVRETPGRSALDALVRDFESRRALIVLDGVRPEAGAGPWLARLLGACAELQALVVSEAVLGVRFENALAVEPAASAGDSALRPEQRLWFWRLAVFAGRFTAESARDVLSRMEAAAPIEQEAVDEAIAAFAAARLTVREAPYGQPCVRILDEERERASAALCACGEEESARGAHAVHIVELAERLAPDLLGAGRRSARQRMLACVDEAWAALGYALERERLDLAARVLQALVWLWITEELFEEGRAFAERAVSAGANDATAGHARGLVLDAAAWLSFFAGDHATAAARGAQALAALGAHASTPEVARAKLLLGMARSVLERTDEGPALLSDALAQHRRFRDPHGTALALIALGERARERADEPAARPLYEEALVLLQRLGNGTWPGHVLCTLSGLRMQRADRANAARLLAEALEFSRIEDDDHVRARYLSGMAALSMLDGRPREAARLFGAACAAIARLGIVLGPLDQREMERHMAAARASLGDETFERCFAEGSHWTVDQAVSAADPGA
jgi:predicted ATPase